MPKIRQASCEQLEYTKLAVDILTSPDWWGENGLTAALHHVAKT